MSDTCFLLDVEDPCLQDGTDISGISFTASYEQQPGEQFFSRLLRFTETTQKCAFQAFFPMNAEYIALGLSLHTSCPLLALDELIMSDMSHTLTFIGSKTDCLTSNFLGVDNVSLVIESELINDHLRLGNIFELHKNLGGPDITTVFARNDYGYTSRFSNMQVSLFGEVFMAEATVVNNHLTVTTAGNVFGYPAEICIKAPSNIANWKTLPLTLEGNLLLGNNSFTQVLTDEIIEKLMMMGLEGNSRLLTAKLSLAQSEDRLNSISYQLNIAIENVTQANETKKAANNAVKAKKAQLLEVEVEFNNSRDVLQDLEEMLDEIRTDQFCADICMPGESCRNCTIPTFVEKTSKCPITIQEKRSVRVPPFF